MVEIVIAIITGTNHHQYTLYTYRKHYGIQSMKGYVQLYT